MDSLLSRIIRAGLIIILIALPLIYSSQTQNSFATPKRVFFQIAVATLLVLFSIQMIAAPGRLTSRSTPLDMLLLAWIAWEAVSSAHSVDRVESMRELIYSACTVAFFFIITRNVDERTQVLTFIGVIAAMGVIEASYGIPERLGLKLLYEDRVKETLSQAEVLAARGSILGTFGNANQLASYLSLTCPLLLGIVCVCRGLRRSLMIVCLAVVLSCLVLIGARGSWLAAFTGLVVFAVWGARGRGRGTRRAIGITILLLVLVLTIVMILKPKIAHELVGRLKGASASLSYRFLAWRVSLRMIAHHPLLGSGPGTFKILFLPSLAEYLRGHDPISYWGLTEKMNEPHNEYLQLAVETGLPGLGFLLLFCGWMVRVALRNLRNLPSPGCFLSVMLMSGLAAVMADAATSITFHVVPTRVAFWAMAALLFSLLKASGATGLAEPQGHHSSVSLLAVSPYLMISLIFSYIAVTSSLKDFAFERNLKRGTNLNHMGLYREAIPFLQRAIQEMPSSGRAKFYYGSNLIQIGRFAEGAAVLEEAKKNFQDVYLFKNLGLAYERLGQPERAIAQYRRWREMGIGSHEASNRIALIRLHQGRVKEAEDLFRETLRVRPWDWIAYSNLASILIDGGRAEEAVRVLNPAPLWKRPESFSLYGAALLAAGHFKEAEQYLLRTYAADPHSIRALNNLAVLYYKSGEKKEAIEQWERVLSLEPGNSFARSNIEKTRKEMR